MRVPEVYSRMKLSCDIVQDLLPLLEGDEAWSAASRQATAIAGSLRKIKQRWLKSLIWIAVAIPFCFLVGIMKRQWNL